MRLAGSYVIPTLLRRGYIKSFENSGGSKPSANTQVAIANESFRSNRQSSEADSIVGLNNSPEGKKSTTEKTTRMIKQANETPNKTAEATIETAP